MDEKYKLLLSEFNEALKLQLIDMRNRTIKLYESLKAEGIRKQCQRSIVDGSMRKNFYSKKDSGKLFPLEKHTTICWKE